MFKTCQDAQREFESCWRNLNYTPIELDDVDVNKTLLHYVSEKPIHFTQQMLWDMEKKKAWNPGEYIPYVIRAGSAKAWNKHTDLNNGDEIFVRMSDQKQWTHPDIYETVYEEVYVNESEQLVTFLGVKILPGVSTELNPQQPLFHVQHGVGGTEDNPINTWRIVHLTKIKGEQLISHFKKMNNTTHLPGFILSYIEKDLHIPIRHK